MGQKKESWQEICARRLTATLARKPRSAKSRAYVRSLPRREPVVVRPEDFAKAAAASVPAPVFSSEREVGAPLRKDRRRPGADPASRWNCRPSGFRLIGFDPEVRGVRRLDKTSAAAFRVLLLRVQDGLCGLCATALSEEPTFDHVVPIAAGGVDALGNLLLAHHDCNFRKANDVPTGCEAVWLLAVNARIGVGPAVF